MAETTLHILPQSVGPAAKASHFASASSTRNRIWDQTVCQNVLSSPFVPKRLLKSQSLNKNVSKCLPIRRSCSANLDEIFHEKSSYSGDGLGKRFDQPSDMKSQRNTSSKLRCTLSETSPSLSKYGMRKGSLLSSRTDFLEPMMLGITPEAPDWPEREAVMWATIEQKAKSFDLPLSLRMIKKKLHCEDSFKDFGESSYCPVKKAFASMVCIVVELQSHALQMREAICQDDLELITAKVQKEMFSSFAWLFQQVFSRTPALMLYVMLLLANFGVHSTSNHVAVAESLLMESVYGTKDVSAIQENHDKGHLQFDSTTVSLERGKAAKGYLVSGGSIGSDQYEIVAPDEFLHSGDQELRSIIEESLWKSMVDEASILQADSMKTILDHDMSQQFVAPVSVELGSDDYADYLRTDLLYQMVLSREPNNPLLLSNYAQFLQLVAHDYDRAEECYKQAVSVEPPDAESLNQYANFLWTVRGDSWGAEERYLQALAADPENSYYASQYANFLWNTGGEETCFPLDNPQSSENTGANL